MTLQGHSHQVWSGQVCTVVLYGRGIWGHAPPEMFWNLEAMRLLLRPFLGQYNASWRPDDRVSHQWIANLFAHFVKHRWCQLPIPCAYRSKAKHFAGEACKTNHSLGRKTRRTALSHSSHHASLNLVPVCLGALRECPPTIGTNWWRQARHEWGKKWSGWNRTNWTGGYSPALVCNLLESVMYTYI